MPLTSAETDKQAPHPESPGATGQRRTPLLVIGLWSGLLIASSAYLYGLLAAPSLLPETLARDVYALRTGMHPPESGAGDLVPRAVPPGPSPTVKAAASAPPAAPLAAERDPEDTRGRPVVIIGTAPGSSVALPQPSPAPSGPVPRAASAPHQVWDPPRPRREPAPAEHHAPIETGTVPARDARVSGIGLGTAPSLDTLRLVWTNVLDKHGAALGSIEPRFIAADNGAYALIAGPLASDADARRVCAELAPRGQPCRVREFKGDALF